MFMCRDYVVFVLQQTYRLYEVRHMITSDELLVNASIAFIAMVIGVVSTGIVIAVVLLIWDHVEKNL